MKTPMKPIARDEGSGVTRKMALVASEVPLTVKSAVAA